MQNFIVLGMVPGTNVLITFNFWLYVTLGLVAVPLVFRAIHWRHKIRAYIASRKIAQFIDQLQLEA